MLHWHGMLVGQAAGAVVEVLLLTVSVLVRVRGASVVVVVLVVDRSGHVTLAIMSSTNDGDSTMSTSLVTRTCDSTGPDAMRASSSWLISLPTPITKTSASVACSCGTVAASETGSSVLPSVRKMTTARPPRYPVATPSIVSSVAARPTAWLVSVDSPM